MKKIELSYHPYKGSGKCWIAKIDKDTRKILGFVNAESNVKDDYKGYKVFRVSDGYYLTCETGTKSYDKRDYIQIKNNEIIKMD